MESDESGGIGVKRKVRVVKGYRTNYPEPLKLMAGEILTLGDRESQYAGWLWCTDKNGNSGWVPENYVEIIGLSVRMNRDYDATELNVDEGDELWILDQESGWVLCRTDDGRLGWLPGNVIRLDQSDET